MLWSCADGILACRADTASYEVDFDTADPDTIADMQVVGPATHDQLILEWLRSEWDGVPPPRPADRQLVDAGNTADSGQNAARAELLYRSRGPILDQLPGKFDPAWVEIEETDLHALFIVPCLEWFLDTGGTFRLVDTAANLAAGRGFLSLQGAQPIGHLTRVDAIAPTLADYDCATTSEVLILIAANLSGPYTIIDGTHRAAALYRQHLSEPNMPWRGILVAEPAIGESLWHIDSARAAANIANLRLAAAQNLLW